MIEALTSTGKYVELESLPSFCVVRKDIIKSSLSVLVGDNYLNRGIFLYAWDIEDNFYIFLKGVAHEAYSIDFDFPVLESINNKVVAA